MQNILIFYIIVPIVTSGSLVGGKLCGAFIGNDVYKIISMGGILQCASYIASGEQTRLRNVQLRLNFENRHEHFSKFV